MSGIQISSRAPGSVTHRAQSGHGFKALGRQEGQLLVMDDSTALGRTASTLMATGYESHLCVLFICVNHICVSSFCGGWMGRLEGYILTSCITQ